MTMKKKIGGYSTNKEIYAAVRKPYHNGDNKAT
jgi:hypothetical protein